jgi:hypothetical protein
MDQKVKTEWVRALRSGEYKQHYGSLCDDAINNLEEAKSFCCIGVLGKITRPENFWYTSGVTKYFNLPNTTVNTLVDMNDSQKKSFSKIADWIEENL